MSKNIVHTSFHDSPFEKKLRIKSNRIVITIVYILYQDMYFSKKTQMPTQLTTSFTSSIDRLRHLLNVHYITVLPSVVAELGGTMKVRLLCSINHTDAFQCGLVALGEGAAYISINTKRMKQLGLKEGDMVHVALQKDTSEFGMEMPDALAVLLEQDDRGMLCFQHLTAGKQRYVIQYVSTVKNPQLRVDRAIMLIENLKKYPLGKASFRQILGLD